MNRQMLNIVNIIIGIIVILTKIIIMTTLPKMTDEYGKKSG